MANEQSVAQAVGSNVRRIREEHGLRQEDVAAAAQAVGLAWRRSSVSMLELGRRALTGDELLLLPFAVEVMLDTAGVARTTTVGLGDLLNPRSATLALSEAVKLDTFAVSEWLGAEALPVEPNPDLRPMVGEAERHAAKLYDTSPEAILRMAVDLWGVSLTAKRDAEVASRAGKKLSDIPARSVQALRGAVTRDLLVELVHTYNEDDPFDLERVRAAKLRRARQNKGDG